MKPLDLSIPQLSYLHTPLSALYHKGNSRLLNQRMISIVGSRRPNQYTQETTFQLARELSKRGVCVVSGAAMGVDAIAHKGAGADNTIAVLPCGLHHYYPATNKTLIKEIADNGLLLSQFEPDFKAASWSFVVRNELVVALGEVLIVTQADLNSGSMRSVEYARKMGKKIFVLPHRLGESDGTTALLESEEAELITDIRSFAEQFGKLQADEDAFLTACSRGISYEEALALDANKLFEYELKGKIKVSNGRVTRL